MTKKKKPKVKLSFDGCYNYKKLEEVPKPNVTVDKLSVLTPKPLNNLYNKGIKQITLCLLRILK